MSKPTGDRIEMQTFAFNDAVVDAMAKNYFVENTWPLVYFIDNQKQKLAYVGESTNALMRIKNHLANSSRRNLDRLTLIASNRFNKSATLDIESKLIQYIVADETYKLQNGNGGLRGHNYYERSEYQRLFEELWEELRIKGYVRKSIHDIESSNLFKYSPYKTLTNDQRSAVFSVIQAILTGHSSSVFVEGSAGTGKTIVATYLMMLLTSPLPSRQENEESETYSEEEYSILQNFHGKFARPRIALVVPMTSLRRTLQKVFNAIPGLSKKMVIGPSDVAKDRYDIVLVDEAHRLARRRNLANLGSFDATNRSLGLGNDGTQLDWLLLQSGAQVFFYDDKQSVRPSDIPKERFDNLKHPANTIKLRSQLRVTAGVDFINFVDDLLHCHPTGHYELPEGYDLRFYDVFADFHNDMNEREEEYALCRKIAGYSWKWRSKKDKAAIDIEIEGLKFQWNMVAEEWINSPNAASEIGCIHTTQGYDLNYAGIIFGHEITYNRALDRIEILAENYFDSNGKKGVKNPDELKAYIINIYKTVMYRGIKGCYVYVCDPALRAYLRERFSEIRADYLVERRAKVAPFTVIDNNERHLHPQAIPLFPGYAAAGKFSEARVLDGCEWVMLNKRVAVDDRYFVLQVKGDSMDRLIPDGAYGLFRTYTGGTRDGKVVLARHTEVALDGVPTGYTVKRYVAEKVESQGRLFNTEVRLEPMSTNPTHQPIRITDATEGIQVLAEFVEVVG